MTEQATITETNFNQYFRDVKKYQREEGDIIVSYRSQMVLPDCALKRDIIRLLTGTNNGAYFAVDVLHRYAAASKKSAIQVCEQMSADLLQGISAEDVASQDYQYEIVVFFYVKQEHFPSAWLKEKNTAWSIVPENAEPVNI
jgi:hypothetical protein